MITLLSKPEISGKPVKTLELYSRKGAQWFSGDFRFWKIR